MPLESQQTKFAHEGKDKDKVKLTARLSKRVWCILKRVVEPSAGLVTPPVTEPVLASTEEPLFCSSSTLGALPKCYSMNCITGTPLVVVESVTSTTSCMEILQKANGPDI